MRKRLAAGGWHESEGIRSILSGYAKYMIYKLLSFTSAWWLCTDHRRVVR